MRLIAISFKGLVSKPVLTLLYVAGVSFIVGIMVCVPVFSDAVSRTILQEEINRKASAVNRPPMSVRFHAIPRSRQPVSLDDAIYVHKWLAEMLTREVGLSVAETYAQYESPTLRLRPLRGDVHYTDHDLASVSVVTVPGIEDRIESVVGLPFGDDVGSDHLSVWMTPDFAEELGIQVGEAYGLAYLSPLSAQAFQPIIAQVEGFVQALDERDRYWYREPDVLFKHALLTTPQQYRDFIAPRTPAGTGFCFWYYILDDARMNLSRAEAYIEGLEMIEREVEERLPNGRMDCAPVDELLAGQQRKTDLSLVLLGFSVPLIVILGYFLVSTGAMVTRSQTQEVAVLVSRGTSVWQILALTSVEAAIMLCAALPLGVLVGLGLARLLGFSVGFLAFAPRPPLDVHIAAADWRLVVVAVATSFAARLIPAWSSARLTVVAYEQQSSRRRAVIGAARLLTVSALAGITLYAYWQLSLRGSMFMFLVGWRGGDSGPSDPLLLLAPTLFLLTAPIIGAELFAIIMRSFVPIGKLMPGATPFLASLSLGREGGQYRAPIYLLVLCLGTGIFYASLAKSADAWLVDRLRYRVGADLTFEQGTLEGMSQLAATGPSGKDAWLLPVSEYQAIDGVAKATRIGEFRARPLAGGGRYLRLIGIDRIDFPEVAYYRQDYADRSLGELMNHLAQERKGLLVPTDLAESLHLALDTALTVNVTSQGELYKVEFVIAGTFDYFPTMYESEAPVLVANLDYLHRQLGGVLPHSIWMRLEPEADAGHVLEEIESLGVLAVRSQSLDELLTFDQERLERVGIFGLLSVSFLVGLIFAGVGLLLYTFASMVGRDYRFSVLRAIGMMRGEVIRMVSSEYLATLLYGLVAGVGLGVVGSYLYVPLFPLTPDPGRPIPPFVPLIDWDSALSMAIVMGGTLLVIEVAILMHVTRQRLFEALRLGVRE